MFVRKRAEHPNVPALRREDKGLRYKPVQGKQWCMSSGLRAWKRTCWSGVAGERSLGHLHSATAERLLINSIARDAPAANSARTFSACSKVHTACTRHSRVCDICISGQSAPAVQRSTIVRMQGQASHSMRDCRLFCSCDNTPGSQAAEQDARHQ